jgi:poly(hydroxyalkanoate) depolymerase family esterase
MKSLWDNAMQKAAELTRHQNVVEATRVIRRALAVRGNVLSPDEMMRQKSFAEETLAVQSPPRDTQPKMAGPAPAAAHHRLPLGDVVDLLRHKDNIPHAAHGLLKQPLARPASVPPGARFVGQDFACAAGTRDYKLYVPASSHEHPLPLILMLHGCSQDPDDFAAGTGMNRLAEEHGFVVAYPRQPPSANQSACWNWFAREHQMRDAGEPLILAEMTRSITERLPIDAKRVFVAGLSAGGAMAAVLGATYPEIFAAVGIHSGLAYGSASDLMSALAAMRGTPMDMRKKRPDGTGAKPVPTIVFHGADDRTVHPSNAERIVAASRLGLPSASAKTLHGLSAGGRNYTQTILSDEDGRARLEHWSIEGLGHAWSGGDSDGSYTDPRGPDASREMVRFFLGATGAKD